MYASMTIATEQIRQHQAAAAAAGRARQIRRARRRSRLQLSVPPRAVRTQPVEPPRPHLRVVA